MPNYNITSASIPDCDEWGWDDWWDCYDWITYYDALKADYGKAFADQQFITEWFNCASFGAGHLDCRTFNPVFRDKMKAEGLLEAVQGGAAVLVGPIGAVTDASGAVVQTIKTGSKILQYGIPILLGGALLGVGWYGYNRFLRRRGR